MPTVGDLQAVTYGLSSAQILLIAWMVFELRAIKDSVREQGSRVRRVEIALGGERLKGIE